MGKKEQKGPGAEDLQLSPELKAALEAAAEEAAGTPLQSGPNSPLARIIGMFVEETLKAEMQQHLGYERYERSHPEQEEESSGAAEKQSSRKNTRNGHSKKRLKTSFGEADIRVPRDREASFEPQIVPKYGRLSQEISERIIAMYGSGMSTGDIAEHISELYQIGIGKNQVSELVQSIEPELRAWRQRPLDSVAPILYLDAMYVKMRRKGRVVTTPIYIAAAYSEAGILEVIGVWVAPEDFSEKGGESSAFWYEAMQELESRGLKEVLMVAIDGLGGLADAVSAVWPRAQIFPCVVHLVRSALRHVPQSRRREVAADLRAIYQAPSFEAAEAALEAAHRKWDHLYASALKSWDQQIELLQGLWGLDPALRRLVYTTNAMENINRQTRKVSKTRSSFPSADSALHLHTMALQRITLRAQARGVRPDWPNILESLHRTFGQQLPEEWGFRLRN